MSATSFAFSLHKPAPRGWVAMLSDGDQEAIVTASDIPSEPLLPLLWAVRLLLLGTSDTRCSWWEEPGEYRWLFSRQDDKLSIHILWFKDTATNQSDEQGKTVLRMECDLLAFAKRLLQQLNQLSYHEKRPAVPPQDCQLFQETLSAYEQGKRRKERTETPKA
jgi:hypothetical protein